MRLLDEVAFIVGSYRQQHGGAGGLRPAVDLCENQDSWYVAPAYAYWAIGKPEYANDVFLPPTLAVEIQSPGQTLGFLRTKCREYRDRGVDVAWLVVPARRAIEVFEPSADGVVRTRADAVESPHLPGFQFVVQELFAVLDD